MRVAILTLGCRTNQAESAGMAEFLRSHGHEIIESGQKTDCKADPDIPSHTLDAVVINTCTVTATADKKSRNAIRKLRRQHPGAILAVCGCLTQTETLEIEGIDLIGGTAGRREFIRALEEKQRGNVTRELPERYEDTLRDARPAGRSRAYIKIQDGCDNTCAYCKVPQARGRARSRPVESVIQAAKEAAESGAIEIVLTGIEISSFRPSLAMLTAGVCRAVDPVPVRLSSLDPFYVDDRFITALLGSRNFLPKFHLSLQSCCDKTLKEMGRRYSVQDIYAAFARLRGGWDNAAVTADIIVGFPGESDDDFEETFYNLTSLKPDGLHVFPYSRREGTAAAAMPGQLTRALKAERARRLAEAFPKR